MQCIKYCLKKKKKEKRGYIRRTTVEGGDARLTTPSFLQDVLLVSDPAGAGLALLAVQAGGVCQS